MVSWGQKVKWALQSFGQVVFLCQAKVNDECMVLRPGWVEHGEAAPAPIQAFSPLWKMPLNCTTFSPRESAQPTYLPRANGGYTCALGTPASLDPEWNYPYFLRGGNKNQNNKTRNRALKGWRAFIHCCRRTQVVKEGGKKCFMKLKSTVFLSCYFCYLKYKKKNVQVLFMVYSHFGNITEYPLFKKRAWNISQFISLLPAP